MKHQIIVGQVNSVYVVSDGGAISEALGVNPSVPWHLVALTADTIGERVEQMENLLDQVLTKSVYTPVSADVAPNGNGNGNGNGKNRLPFDEVPAQEAVDAICQNFRELQQGKRVSKLTLSDLGLNKRQLWRLEKAVGGTSLEKLGGMTEEQLAAKKGIGPAVVEAVKKGLKRHGLGLS